MPCSGRRPVILCGYGMGEQVVFHCLTTLAEEDGVQGRGIVENAVLIGMDYYHHHHHHHHHHYYYYYDYYYYYYYYCYYCYYYYYY